MATLVAAALRLYDLHEPQTPVYDETHVGRFLNWYHEGAFFFDVHGPLAKLMMYWTASALGFVGRASCPYESTAPYAARCHLAPQRLLPALCGAAIVPLALCSCRRMGLHPVATLLAGWLLLTDTQWLALSRLHLNDMVMMLFIAATFHHALRACAPPPPPPMPLPSLSALCSGLVATGLALGCALQCKYAMALTTVGWVGLQNAWLLLRLVEQRRSWRRVAAEAALRGTLLLGIPVALHLALFALHLAHVPNTGNGDGYLSEEFQSTLQGSVHAVAAGAAGRPSLLSLAAEHALAQFRYNRNMAILFPRGSHPFDSAWWSWPLAMRGVYFNLVPDFAAVASSLHRRHRFGLFIHPNPITVLTTTAVAALTAAALLLRLLLACRVSLRVRQHACLAQSMRPGGSASLLLAYLLHWVPYATQQRQTFSFYYVPAYYFAILLTARACDAALKLSCFGARALAALTTAFVAVAIGAAAWKVPFLRTLPSTA